MNKEPKYVADTLKWCNERRKEQGKKPLKKMPKGEVGEAASCPCGKAAGVFVGLERWDTERVARFGHNLPEPVMQFVRAFDAGKLPHYIA